MTMENPQEDKTVQNAEFICAEAEIKGILNKGVRVCCPNCHSEDYEIYPTGQLGMTIRFPEEDLHWVCKQCGYIWNSEFLAERYEYHKSCLTGRFCSRYRKKGKLWKIWHWLGWR